MTDMMSSDVNFVGHLSLSLPLPFNLKLTKLFKSLIITEMTLHFANWNHMEDSSQIMETNNVVR